MSARQQMIANSRSARLLGVLALAASVAIGCGPTMFEIPIETPIKPKLDTSAFQRVLIAGFVAGGNDEVDTNQETVRLLRSQLRTKSSLRVIDADVLDLEQVAREQSEEANTNTNTDTPDDTERTELPEKIHSEKDLEPYERLFANVDYWKKIGEEYQNPLIVTGTVLFAPNERSGYVQRETEVFDSFGRRSVAPVREFQERKGFVLAPKFVFIDGRTGATMYSETYHEEVLYSSQTNTPALSSYFELMDRLVPNFLSALSSQKVRGTRILLK
jgi:hypothetical protein